MEQRAVPLLNLLASLPREFFVEGAELEVERVDGQRVTLRFGEQIPAGEQPAFFTIAG